jgi:hypothetical protein
MLCYLDCSPRLLPSFLHPYHWNARSLAWSVFVSRHHAPKLTLLWVYTFELVLVLFFLEVLG